ncbi:hypothetical protein [Streptomyces chattanoogensis]|uniref:Uncharacterized protein n=1 Tax=Streptomyces chattanoogensis TaxID=66876 RepID=A0A0N0XQW7_9ACTN|nr:hypothetical protein [Streptomyces chattanoogensis]AJT67009.1 hypothetical protein T261_5383 [Streptomyces lydicus]KPC59008.1 hypothetical protein ADL29_38300 [Streptomyces chattanoogensis]
MRKLQQVAIVATAAAGGLSVISAGAGTAYAGGHEPKVKPIFRPYQECSPQTFAQAKFPIDALLGASANFDTTCGQFNHAFTKH